MEKYLSALPLLVIFTLFSFQSPLWATEIKPSIVVEETPEMQSSDLLVAPELNDGNGAPVSFSESENELLLLPYRPGDFEDPSLAINFTRSQLMNQFFQSLNAEMPTDFVLIPAGPTSIQQIEKLQTLNDAELMDFLRKKQSFLSRFASVLKTLRLKPKTINQALREVNEEFFKSSALIARSNAIGTTLMFSVSGGLALPKKIVERLRDRPIGRFIPDSGGFYYLLGLGAGVTRVSNPQSNKNKWYLELFMDTERLKNTLSGLVEFSAAGTYGVVYEYRPDSFWTQKMDTTYGGLAGLFKKGPNQFGWAASTGLSVPPGIGAFLIYQDFTTRRYFLRLNISPVFLPFHWTYRFFDYSTKAFGAWIRNPLGRSCRKLFTQ